MLNLTAIRKKILDNITYLTDLHKRLEEVALDPEMDTEVIAENFAYIEKESAYLVEMLKHSIANQVKLASNEEEVDIAVEPTENGFKF